MTEAERLKPKATLHSPISSVADLASELSGALIDCPLIDELAFLPSAAPTDVFGLDQCFPSGGFVTSTAVPGAFLLAGRKLAIAVHMLMPLYYYISAAHKRAYAQHKDGDIPETVSFGIDPITGLDTFRLLLLINGEHNTAWNGLRRRLLHNVAGLSINACVDVAVRELCFAEAILCVNPKATTCWVYRRWILNNLSFPHTNYVTGTRLKNMFANEVTMVERAIRFRRLKYAAWTHLSRCSKHYFSWSKRTLLPPAFVAILIERVTSHTWRNMMDSSLLYYLQMLSGNFLFSECQSMVTLITRVLEIYPEREAAWTYRRFLSAALAHSLEQRLDSDTNSATDIEEPFISVEELYFVYHVLKRNDNTRHKLEKDSCGSEPSYYTAVFGFWTLELSRRMLIHTALGKDSAWMVSALTTKRKAVIADIAQLRTWNPAAVFEF
jgi:hypothetical protein